MTEQTEAVRDQAYAATQDATDQVRQWGERATGTGRAFGQLALDSYEQAVASFVEFEQRAADAAPFDWAKAAIGAHASFIENLNAAYVRAARAVLD
jgi:hypothetical protein